MSAPWRSQQLQEPRDDPRESRLKVFSSGCLHGLKDRDPVGEAIDPIKQQAMQVDIEISGGAKPLDKDHRAGLGLGLG